MLQMVFVDQSIRHACNLSQVPLAENLADMLLQPKAARRMSAEQALRHRYFAELPPAIHDLGDGESEREVY